MKRQKEKKLRNAISYTGRAITLWASGRKQKNGEIMQRGQVVLNQLSNLFFFFVPLSVFTEHMKQNQEQKKGGPLFSIISACLSFTREREIRRETFVSFMANTYSDVVVDKNK